MFSNFTVALVFGLGLGGWVYGKVLRRTGGNTSNALMTAGFCGVIGAIVILTVLSILF